MLIDVHTHLDFPQFDSDRKEIVGKASEDGILIINSGIGPEGIEKTINLIEKHEGILATLGLSPQEFDSGVIDETIRLIRKYKNRIVGIGEVGLDYYWIKEPEKRGRGMDNFRRFISLAKELSLPLVVHSRDAENEMVEELKAQGIKALLHCFGGSAELGKKAISFGCLVSIPTSVAYSKRKQELVGEIPLEAMVLESDAPYLAPTPRERNTPLNIRIAAKKIAEIKGIEYDKVAEITTRNAREFFNLRF
ncbi:MAG: TatD family hydrolase [Candidatus Altiarchaeales archaeon]|nr:TatD family hydrolase [Candidatus Altiarchaeota archaeon]MCG2782877.1 TatD family hydrolase [Candidatus Altiarchaeales archaeon]